MARDLFAGEPWGVFKLTPYRGGPDGFTVTAIQMMCKHPSHNQPGQSWCTKSRSVMKSGEEDVRRRLKLWALNGLCLGSKAEHNSAWSDILKIPTEELPSEEELDRRCPLAWPGEI